MIKNALFSWRPGGQFRVEKGELDFEPDIVMYFAEMTVLNKSNIYEEIKKNFSNKTTIVGCSTSKPILMDDVFEGFVTGIALKFEKTKIKTFCVPCSEQSQSFKSGKKLAKELDQPDLAHIYVISDGMNVNGTTLMNGLYESLSKKVPITGGMACDGNNFSSTLVGLDKTPEEKHVIAVGFYGHDLEVGYAAEGGWEPFGIDRVVTRSDENVLYELDAENALDLYLEYMGGETEDLATRALMFPFSIRKDKNSEDRIIRTFDKVNEEDRSLRFSGDIPQGAIVQFMKGSVEKLAEGARSASELAIKNITPDEHTVALAVSCLGRQIALGQRVSDELDSIVEILGRDVSLVGFYSHGEFCPIQSEKSVLHNQTMTLTVLKEK